MANDVIVTVSMSVKPEQLETLSRHAAGPALPMKVTDHVRRLAGRKPITFRAFVEARRVDLTPGV